MTRRCPICGAASGACPGPDGPNAPLAKPPIDLDPKRPPAPSTASNPPKPTPSEKRLA